MTSKTIPPESVWGEPCTDTKVCTMHNLHCGFPNCAWGKATTKPKTIPPEEERLLPCPFCGCAGKFVSVMGEWKSRAEGYEPNGLRISCSSIETGCWGMGRPFYGDGMRHNAIAAWNRRAQPDREAIIEECAKAAEGYTQCPFSEGAPPNDLEPTDPCPICGDLGTYDEDKPSNCGNVAAIIRSLKHSDTTSNGGKNG